MTLEPVSLLTEIINQFVNQFQDDAAQRAGYGNITI